MSTGKTCAIMMTIFRGLSLNLNHIKAVKETLASRTSTGRGRHRLRAPSGWTLAHREHSGAGISKDMDMQKAGRVRRGIRQAHVTCLKEWSRFCSKGSRRQVSMRVVPRNITRV